MASRRADIRFKSIDTVQEWKWLKLYLPNPLAYDAEGLIAYRNGTPVAGLAMQHFCSGSVELHQVILKPMIIRHGWIELVAKVAFGDSRQCIYGLVSEDKPKALKLNDNIGFKVAGRIPSGDSPGVDLLLLVLPREECRFLKENNDGRRQNRSS